MTLTESALLSYLVVGVMGIFIVLVVLLANQTYRKPSPRR